MKRFLALAILGSVLGSSCATERYIEGRNAGVTYENGHPTLFFVESEKGDKQVIEVARMTRIRDGVCSGENLPEPGFEAPAPIDTILLRTIEHGGGRICADLVKRDGHWVAKIVHVVPTPEQRAALAEAYAEDLRKQRVIQERQEEESALQRAQAEAIRKAEIAAWQKRRHKPPLPEEARRNAILAETAIKEKRFIEAIRYYEAGLQVERLWPEGHFRVAMLYEETSDFGKAVEHLHWYLDLVPDADDAPAARDKLAVLEQKAPKAAR
jgi:hypothetical protein